MPRMTQYGFKRLLAASARFFSTVLSPLLMPTYGTFHVLWVSVLCLLPNGTRITVLAIIFGNTCVLPMILVSVLHHYGIITDKRLNKQHERLIPYAFSALCYCGAALYLNYIHSPAWFVMFMVGAAAAVAICLIINLFWKISAHMCGIGGVVALLFQLHVQGLSAFNLFWVFIVTILLAGILGTSRMVLRRHTVMQVLTGFAIGYVAVTVAMKYFG